VTLILSLSCSSLNTRTCRRALPEVSQWFGVLAREIVSSLPSNPERTVALRKLLEAKDAAVRARLYREWP
jgi:hypothetical protein